jgi:hypothetical protein
MRKIIEYKLVEVPSYSVQTLEVTVNNLIKLGWEPFGNLFVMSSVGGNTLCQPMVKCTTIGEETVGGPR